jgi:multicomponent Na+:H+ antiporter subunit C
MSVLLAATAAGLFGIGTYLVMQRKLSRILIGLSLYTHAANVLMVISGRRGAPPFIGSSPPDEFSDPLPEALALTSIVISFAASAFLLALAYRSWLLTHDDEVESDPTDREVARGGLRDKEVVDQMIADAEEQRSAP